MAFYKKIEYELSDGSTVIEIITEEESPDFWFAPNLLIEGESIRIQMPYFYDPN